MKKINIVLGAGLLIVAVVGCKTHEGASADPEQDPATVEMDSPNPQQVATVEPPAIEAPNLRMPATGLLAAGQPSPEQFVEAAENGLKNGHQFAHRGRGGQFRS